jgi:hypothetical protein
MSAAHPDDPVNVAQKHQCRMQGGALRYLDPPCFPDRASMRREHRRRS